ncbi:hypothetical protein ACSBR1_037694 [Camellia fascicularis]
MPSPFLKFPLPFFYLFLTLTMPFQCRRPPHPHCVTGQIFTALAAKFAHNKFSGDIPPAICRLPELQYLYLYGN